MCNQCDDIRRIHGKVKVFLIMQDGRAVMQMTTQSLAERAIALLQPLNPQSEYEILEANSIDTRWDG
jgi:hypothetical protein